MQHNAVLIIDDDPSICQSISRVCSRSGFGPVVASSSGDFATAIRNRSLLLVITDLQMPDFDGIEFMRLLSEARTDVPVVILSGFDPRDIERREDAKVIVQTLIDLAHNLSLKACAEGVETEAEWRLLVQYGCDRVQGFYTGRPMTATEIPAWLDHWAARRSEIESIGKRKLN